jgi:N,N-dimethylformamidase
MATQRIYGYADPWSIKAGETLSFMVSGEGLEAVDAQLVRLIHGDESSDGPGFI